MRYLATLTLVAAALFAAGRPATPAAHASATQPMCAIDDSGNCLGGCNLYDTDCVLADSGYYETDVSSTADTTGYDLYGSGAFCRWVAIRDYWYQYPIGSKSWVGVLQAYVCRRGGVVTRFDQISAFAQQLFGFPWNQAYHLVWSQAQAPAQPTVPVSSTSTTAVLSVQVCAWFKPVCSNTHYPRYVIQATGSSFTCYVDGTAFADCVGHRYR